MSAGDLRDAELIPLFTVSVGLLADFCTRRGDLHLGFTPAPSSKEGIEGHQQIYARRPKHYQSEVTLSLTWQQLLVRGRADGFDPERSRLEEIKTFRGRYDNIPDNKKTVQWAQAKLYGWMLCVAQQRTELEVALVYLNIDSGKETLECQTFTADELASFFTDCCKTYHAWMVQEAAHRASRQVHLSQLTFPYDAYRPGQRELAESVYKAVALATSLCVEAPTGLGKTLATVFPAFKAMATKNLDRMFYLTARTSGRRLALDAFQQLSLTGLRVLEMVAREQVCLYPDRACQGDSCPLAQGFYDRLPQARQAAVDHSWLDQAAVSTLAADHDICPYFLSQELCHWSDVVVGDYNHFFDLHAALHALVGVYDWKAVVLMDEAHNLIDRARTMYSAALDRKRIVSVKKLASPAVKKALEALNRKLRALSKGLPEQRYCVLAAAPECLQIPLQGVVQAVVSSAAQEQADPIVPEVLQLFFDVMHFGDILTLFGDDYVFDLERDPSYKRMERYQLRNLIPGPLLAERYAKAHAVIQFSATLQPWSYLKDILGHSSNAHYLQVPPHFSSDQLQVFTSHQVSTKYHDRQRSLPALVAVVGLQVLKHPGNYLVYFSSFTYLKQFYDAFSAAQPQVETLCQQSGMPEIERHAFLARFHDGKPIVGLAVLGGVFGEGIDLVGDKLIGAFIVTLGLPQWNPVNEQLKHRLQHRYGKGYLYAYLYPGLQKVVQAAGRVIRTDSDQGFVFLLDTRFNEPDIQQYLPSWWQIRSLH